MKCHNIIEKDNRSQQVLKFVTIKTEQSKEKQALVRRTCQFLFADSRILVLPLIGWSRSKCYKNLHGLCTRNNMHLFFPHIHLLSLGLMASRQLRLCFLWLTVKLQLCSWWWYNQRYHFFSLLKHTCLIIFSIDFLIQPPDLNEVFRLVYDILIPHCFCQKVSWRIMPEHYNTNSPFEGLRGQLCWGFAGRLQLSRKVLTQAAYAIYRAVIQSYLTACVQFSRYVAKLIMNSTVNGSSGSWSCLDFTALKIGGTVAFCLIIIISLVANSLIVILVCKTPNLKKPIKLDIMADIM